MKAKPVFGLLVVAGLSLLAGGCATSRPSGTPQWIVVSTNSPHPRLATATVPAGPVTNVGVPAAQLRSELASSGVSTQLLTRVSENKPLTLPDLEELAQKKVNDTAVLNYLRTTDTVYVLRWSDLERLRQAGVSDSILDYLLSTRLQPTIIPYYRPSSAYPPSYYYRDPFWHSPAYYPYYYHHHHHSFPRSVIRKN